MSATTLSPGWKAVHGLQHYLENNKWLDTASLAAEEALTDVLDAFLSGESVSDSEIGRRFHSHRLNRRRRNRHREKLLATHADRAIRPQQEEHVSDASVAVEDMEFLHTVELKLDAASFMLLKRFADGTAYSELAVEFGVLESALRTKACRVREKARTLAA